MQILNKHQFTTTRKLVATFAAVGVGSLSAAIEAEYSASHQRLIKLVDTEANYTIEIDKPLFSVEISKGEALTSSDFKVVSDDKDSTHFVHAESGLKCVMKKQLSKSGFYIRHKFTLTATKPIKIASFAPLLISEKGFSKSGSVLGSPLVSHDWFAAMEYPMSMTELKSEGSVNWTPGQLDNSKWSKISIPVEKRNGEFQLAFDYQRGSQKLLIRKVSLYADGKLISEDEHQGESGGVKKGHIYKLDAKSNNGALVAIAEVKGDQNKDSYGRISVVGEKPKAKFFKQGVNLQRQLNAGDSISYSSVIGHKQDTSLRRSFSEYLEASRARPYQMFLHYNSWYDICHSTPRFNLTSENCSRVMTNWHKKLTEKHGVKLDSYVFDDGWDDYTKLWQFHKERFPQGFTPQAKLASEFGTNVGVWFSPFGGYGNAKHQRTHNAKKWGCEVNGAGLSLAGEKYYALFLKQCRMMMKEYKVNYFKFDGLGGANPAYLPDVEAAYRLMETLRKDNPDVYINLTTGTWASPFFLLHGDSTWRGGGDVFHRGSGSKTQKWMNYRDGETYKNIVTKGKFFPLNSLMIHGVVYANRGEGKSRIGDSDEEFAMQAWSSFASGSQLQEFYISEDRMNEAKWKTLADSAKWGRKNQAILKDVHWIGGDPYKEELYGWASLSPDSKKAIICFRNPSGKEISSSFDLKKILETKTTGWKVSAKPYGKAETTVDAGVIKTTAPAHKLYVVELTR